MAVIKNEDIISVRLSKSGKAVLLYDEEGRAYMTSVAYMNMLLSGKARNNMIAARLLGDNTTNHFNRHKTTDVSGDPMDSKAVKQRANAGQKVKGDW